MRDPVKGQLAKGGNNQIPAQRGVQVLADLRRPTTDGKECDILFGKTP
ncbi:hypothetical protein [Polaromonas sp.]